MLIDRHRAGLVRLTARLIGDADEAEDVAQEALTIALKRLDQLKEPAKIGPWLGAIALNLCRQRGRRGSPVLLPLIEDPAGHGDSQRQNEDLGAILSRTAQRILGLPARQSAAAAWFYFNGATYAQIAEALGSSPAAVQSLLQRARTQLRRSRDDIFEAEDPVMRHEPFDLDIVVSRPIWRSRI